MKRVPVRRWAAAAAAAGLLLMCAACGGTAAPRRSPSGVGGAAKAPPAPPKPAATQVTTFTPSGFTATSTVDGYCWVGSVAAPRAGAYRCMAGNAIHDPCFTGLADGEVACPAGDPAKHTGTVIRLTKALPSVAAGSPSPAHPWYFRLAGGGACGAMTGTIMPGHPFGCASPQVFCTTPVKSGSWYTVGCAPLSKRRAVSGAPRLGRSKTYRVAAMWL